ncbi:hippocalcin-like protein 1 [Watersipora subatra]|uniref:hippocalcin-like protein 1 n=1 Tax=Watersipora subatra TaxID=2589382 RepID=UPI00355B5E7A
MGSENGKLKPEVMKDLRSHTFLLEDEIQDWYKQFIKDHPTGYLKREQFEELYSKNFPDGDASKFASHVFRTFDKDDSGSIDFKEFVIGLSITRRGTRKQKLKWAFNLYDSDKDGYITKQEMINIVKSIEKMTGESGDISKGKIKEVFSTLDADSDGRLTFDEFSSGAESFPKIVDMLGVDENRN